MSLQSMSIPTRVLPLALAALSPSAGSGGGPGPAPLGSMDACRVVTGAYALHASAGGYSAWTSDPPGSPELTEHPGQYSKN